MSLGHSAALSASHRPAEDDRWPLPQAALFMLGSSLALWFLIIKSLLWLIG